MSAHHDLESLDMKSSLYIYTNTHVYTSVYIFTNIYTHTYAYISINIYIYISMLIIHRHVCVWTCIYIHLSLSSVIIVQGI